MKWEEPKVINLNQSNQSTCVEGMTPGVACAHGWYVGVIRVIRFKESLSERLTS